jgi:hypothetical protein
MTTMTARASIAMDSHYHMKVGTGVAHNNIEK